MGCRDSEKANKQGLPVDDLDMVDWKEGAHISSGGGSLGLIKGGPHPNAAKLFINWFLSRRGQIALQNYEDLYGEDPPNSRRIDIPKDMSAGEQPARGRAALFRLLRPQALRYDADLSIGQGIHERA